MCSLIITAEEKRKIFFPDIFEFRFPDFLAQQSLQIRRVEIFLYVYMNHASYNSNREYKYSIFQKCNPIFFYIDCEQRESREGGFFYMYKQNAYVCINAVLIHQTHRIRKLIFLN